MVKINLSVEATTHEELVAALRDAGPNVHTFYGEIVKEAPAGASFQGQPAVTEEDLYNGPPAEEPTEEPIPEPMPVYTKDQVRAELRKVMQTQSSEAMRDILKRFGSQKLDEVDEAHYPAIVAAVQEALASAG